MSRPHGHRYGTPDGRKAMVAVLWPGGLVYAVIGGFIARALRR